MSDEITCEFCTEVVRRSNYSRHRRRRHPDQFSSLFCRGVTVADVRVSTAVPTVGAATTFMSTPTPSVMHRSEAGGGVAPPPPLRLSSAANQLVEAAQSLLERCPLASVDELCDYVRQNYASVPEHELFSLVVGAVAGAQLAAAHHFAVERGRVSYGRDMVNMAINTGAFLAMWNLALPRLTAAPTAAASVPEPRPRSEAPFLPGFIRHEFPGPQVQ